MDSSVYNRRNFQPELLRGIGGNDVVFAVGLMLSRDIRGNDGVMSATVDVTLLDRL